jgi:hypothetical protein
MIHYNLVACVQAFNKACRCIKDKKKNLFDGNASWLLIDRTWNDYYSFNITNDGWWIRWNLGSIN